MKLDPITVIKKLQRRINKKVELALGDYKKPYSQISQNANYIEIEVKLPKIDQKNVVLDINSRGVKIVAENRKVRKRRRKKDILEEREHKGYYRYISLPENLAIEDAKVNFKGNTLKIKIPKN